MAPERVLIYNLIKYIPATQKALRSQIMASESFLFYPTREGAPAGIYLYIFFLNILIE